MNICVIGGAGYVGLITGIGLAELGNRVINVDINKERVDQLNRGNVPIFEEGIEPLLRRNLDANRIQFCTGLVSAIGSSDVVFIAVGTPPLASGSADLSSVIQVAEELLRCMAGESGYKVIVVKSTVPVGTVELVRTILCREKREGQDFDIVSNPEFLREGKGLQDFFNPDRIVIGTSSERAGRLIEELHGPVIRGEVDLQGLNGVDNPTARSHGNVPVVETTIASAQMIKYASNAFLATRVSFVNEIAGLCERVGADIKDTVLGMGYDSRIGHAYLEAGLGFGGPCLEKDLRALIKIAETNSYEPELMRAVLQRNDRQIEEVIVKLKNLRGNLLYKKSVAVFGLTFKAGTNDLRNSLALRVIDQLEKEGAVVRAHDPLGIPEARLLKPSILCCEDPYDTVKHAEALLVLTEWPSFRELDYSEIKARMAFPCVVDCRNLLDAAELRALGFTYVGMGTP